ncbi:hypothetical protein CBR_g48839 [Chara braunii]|uniref:Uncharacterized protein n=1 Tax=Chara braunii TaxID=69332 RepID=A0A388M3H0_CHABU|nr:hypothetical protein CBR_g48839 [Chara braunii]|eukprot:GBG89130.1 hypothetical protein CBR_g48839 [Chara braunii]
MADAMMSSVHPLAPSPAALRAELSLAIRSQAAGGKRQAGVRQRRSWTTDLCRGALDHSSTWWSPRGPAAPSIPTQRRSDAFARRACPGSSTTTTTSCILLRDRSLLPPALPPLPPPPPSPLPPSPSLAPPTGSRRSASSSSRSRALVVVAHCQAGEGDRDSPGRDDLDPQSRSSMDGGDPVVGRWDPNDQSLTSTTTTSRSSITGADLGACHESLPVATTAADGNTGHRGGESRVALREWSRNRRRSRRSRSRRKGEAIWQANGGFGLEFEPLTSWRCSALLPLTSWRCSALRFCLFILRAHRAGGNPPESFLSPSATTTTTTASSSSSACQSYEEEAMAARKMEGALVALGGDTAMAGTKEQWEEDRAEAREQQDRAVVHDESVREQWVNGGEGRERERKRGEGEREGEREGEKDGEDEEEDDEKQLQTKSGSIVATESTCVVSDLLTSSERDLGGDGGDGGGDINVLQGDHPHHNHNHLVIFSSSSAGPGNASAMELAPLEQEDEREPKEEVGADGQQKKGKDDEDEEGNGNGGFTSSSSSSLADDVGTSSRAIEAETEVIPSSSSSSSSVRAEIAGTTEDDETRIAKLSAIESNNLNLNLNKSNLSSCPLESASSEVNGELFLDRRRNSSAEGSASVPTANSSHGVREDDEDDEDEDEDGDRHGDLNSRRRRGMSWNSDRDPDFESESSLDDSRERGGGGGGEDGPDPSKGRPRYRDDHRDSNRAMSEEGQAAKTEGQNTSSSSSSSSLSGSGSGSQLDHDCQSSFCTTTDELHCGVVHPGALSRTKTTITTDSRSKTAVVAVESSVTFTGDDSSSSSLEVDDYLALAENCVLKRASELMNKTRREQLMMGDTGDANGRTAEVYEKHRAIVSVLEEGKVVAARPTQPPSIFGHESFVLQLRDSRTGLKANAIFKPRVGDGDAEGWHRPPIELVAYKLNLMLGMDYVPPVGLVCMKLI